MMNVKYIIFIIIFSGNIFSAEMIVEMKKPLLKREFHHLKKAGASVELFDQTKTEYFKRTYRISGITKRLLQEIVAVKLIEEVTTATMYGIIPSRKSIKLKDDSLFPYQWNLYNQEQELTKLVESSRLKRIKGIIGADINFKAGISLLENNLKKTPIVAVIDMGLDLNHPEFQGQILKNNIECNELGEITDLNEDRDDNGLKGDCQGWNFAARNMNEARRPFDDNGHGTHVAGIIAAKNNNKNGISGISNAIKILPIRVTGSIDESQARQEIQPLTDRIAKGILYATNMKADVINLSLGWTKSMDTKYLKEALDYAASKGVIIVAAAGNNNNNANIYPCAYYSVICVGAVTINGEMADFSNYGGEVDVLAPGDEIVSTIPWQSIPLQLNLQGYDIRSGTSQAAPHVSALAALLKGNFPEASMDEIFRRIIDSTKKSPNIDKANFGLIDYQKAFDLQNAPSLKPILKNFSLVLFDFQDRSIKYPIAFKNFGTLAKNVTVKIKSLSAGVEINNDFLFEEIKPGQIVRLDLDGKITTLLAHNLIQIEFEVKSVDESGEKIQDRIFRHEFRLSYDVFKSKNFQKKLFTFNNSPLPVGTIKDNKAINYIQTVEVLFREDSAKQEFYLPKFNKEKTQYEIKFFRDNLNEIQEVEGTIVIPESVDLLNVYRFDANNDGTDDYLIRTVNCSEQCDDRQKAKRYIQYSYWSGDLKPLLGEKSFWKFLPKLVNVNFPTQRFHYVNIPDIGTIALPYFIESTIIPKDQQDNSPFALFDETFASRLLRLYPKYIFDDQNKMTGVELETQIVSNHVFLKNIKSAIESKMKSSGVFGIKNNIQALKTLSLTKDDFKKGELKVLFSNGEGVLGQNVIVTLNNNVPKMSLVNNLPTLWGFEQFVSLPLKSSSEVKGEVKNNFVGLISSTLLQTVHLESLELDDDKIDKNVNDIINDVIDDKVNEVQFSTTLYNSQGTAEPPLAHIASYYDEDHSYTFIQTPSKITLLKSNVNNHEGQSETTSYTQNINRFSFLPGYVFADTFYPIRAKIEGQFVPALYVDETQIQNYLVSLTIFSQEEIKNPLGFSLFVPPICKTLNPIESDDGAYNLSMLCWNKNQWELMTIPFEIQ